MKRTLVLVFCVLDFVISCLGCAVGITTGELIPAGGSCYQVVSESLPRQAAVDRCTSGGGSLGVLPNNAALTEVGNRVKERSEYGSVSSTIFWLGMNITRGRLIADNGQEVLLSTDVVQPSRVSPQGPCVFLSISSGDPNLISADCVTSYWMYGYVCQYDRDRDMFTGNKLATTPPSAGAKTPSKAGAKTPSSAGATTPSKAGTKPGAKPQSSSDRLKFSFWTLFILSAGLVF